jgi:hypothetical protein
MSSCQDILNSHACSIPISYLRPDSGNALIPWVLSSLLLILHLPLVLVRVLRWEKAQIWSLAMATFSIILTCLAYASTELQPDEILTWAPLPLVLDVGSVLQIFILLIEEDMVVSEGRSVLGRTVGWMRRRQAVPRLPPSEEELGYPLRRTDSNSSFDKLKKRRMNPVLAMLIQGNHGVLLIVCVVNFFALVTLQIVGLIHSIRAYSQYHVLETQWCSPALQLGSQLIDGTCQTHNITLSDNGTGCASVPDNLATSWLLVTTVVLIIELVIEVIDALILINVNAERKLWVDIKKKRPWFSMIFGIGVLAAFIAIGVIQSRFFPLPGGNHVAIIGRAEGTCTSNLYYGGLRGSIIAWSDGILEKLSTAYYGPAGS